jgi:predicted nucleic acid-binding protein
LILLDSTVIVGFLDADDALHEAGVRRLRQIISADPLVASLISYAQVMTGVLLGHHARESVDGFFEAFIRSLLPMDRHAAARAAELRGARPSLAMPDALILATADGHPALDTVLCADAQGQGPQLRRGAAGAHGALSAHSRHSVLRCR